MGKKIKSKKVSVISLTYYNVKLRKIIKQSPVKNNFIFLIKTSILIFRDKLEMFGRKTNIVQNVDTHLVFQKLPGIESWAIIDLNKILMVGQMLLMNQKVEVST